MGRPQWPRLPFQRRQQLRPVERYAVAGCGKVTISGRYFRLPKRVEDDYQLLPTVLGRGAAGAVQLARSLHCQRDVAVKVFALPLVSCLGDNTAQRWAFANEVEIALSMDHPHVARLLGVYESERKLHMVMEHLSGGTLLDHMREVGAKSRGGRFPEEEAADLAHQMLLAVNYMHSHGLVHRDLKPGNFVYEGPTGESERGSLKLIDFGFSGHLEPGRHFSAAVGTAGYVAPEVLDAEYTAQCDMWSFGVIMFRLLLGHMPFECESRSEEVRRIREGNFLVQDVNHWWKLSKQARSFLVGLLKVDPSQRLTAEEALQHPWVATRGGTREALSPDLRPRPGGCVVQALREYTRLSRLERACRTLMAWSTERSEGATFATVFETVDKNCDGKIQLGELEDALWDEARVSREECAKIFEALDASQNGVIEYSEFVAAFVPSGALLSEERLRGAFRTLDVDDHQCVTASDLRAALGDSFEGATPEELLQEANFDPKGRISYHDFAQFLRTHGEGSGRPTTKQETEEFVLN